MGGRQVVALSTWKIFLGTMVIYRCARFLNSRRVYVG
jgi:hypothetical protein